MRNKNGFNNCPFDEEFKPSFEALIFTIAAGQYDPRCALEDNNFGDIRFDKLCRLIDVNNDPAVHHNRPADLIAIVRRFLHTKPDGTPFPGAASILRDFKIFKSALPKLASSLKITADETDPYRDYRTYLSLLTEFLISA